jgi:hypothetical protein
MVQIMIECTDANIFTLEKTKYKLNSEKISPMTVRRGELDFSDQSKLENSIFFIKRAYRTII